VNLRRKTAKLRMRVRSGTSIVTAADLMRSLSNQLTCPRKRRIIRIKDSSLKEEMMNLARKKMMMISFQNNPVTAKSIKIIIINNNNKSQSSNNDKKIRTFWVSIILAANKISWVLGQLAWLMCKSPKNHNIASQITMHSQRKP
jgi:hypothetical protein